jgi:hypothetical protein
MYAIARFGFKEPPRPTHYILYPIALEKDHRLEIAHSRLSSYTEEFNVQLLLKKIID